MLHAAQIGEAVRELIPRASSVLRPDMADAMRRAMVTERFPRARDILGQLIENADLAETQSVPICQDTGTVWVRVVVGSDETLMGDVQSECDAAVAAAYHDARLRMSTVRDALLDRSNPGDNTPAFVDMSWREGCGADVHVMLKGGGSDNASRVEMLSPAAGWEGVRRVVVEAVEAKATGACPPLLIGVGVGGTFDTVAKLAKKALLRPIDPLRQDGLPGQLRELQAELLAAVNSLGIGPAGLGGDTTALAVNLATAPCHIAALPVAVNLGCCAVRSASVSLESR